jgi:hypothetical protein
VADDADMSFTTLAMLSYTWMSTSAEISSGVAERELVEALSEEALFEEPLE